jgi:hypothetical protein
MKPCNNTLAVMWRQMPRVTLWTFVSLGSLPRPSPLLPVFSPTNLPVKESNKKALVYLWHRASFCSGVSLSSKSWTPSVFYSTLFTMEGLRSALFWAIAQNRVAILYRRFGTTYQSRLQGSSCALKMGLIRFFPKRRHRITTLRCVISQKRTSWPLKMEPIRCPETSVNNYHTTPRDVPEERVSHLHRGGSLKSRMEGLFWCSRSSILRWCSNLRTLYSVMLNSVKYGVSN